MGLAGRTCASVICDLACLKQLTEGSEAEPAKCPDEGVQIIRVAMEMGALLAILFRLSSTFELIANTQRELRRAIYHLGERRAREPSNNNRFGGPRTTLVSRSRWVPPIESR